MTHVFLPGMNPPASEAPMDIHQTTTRHEKSLCSKRIDRQRCLQQFAASCNSYDVASQRGGIGNTVDAYIHIEQHEVLTLNTSRCVMYPACFHGHVTSGNKFDDDSNTDKYSAGRAKDKIHVPTRILRLQNVIARLFVIFTKPHQRVDGSSYPYNRVPEKRPVTH